MGEKILSKEFFTYLDDKNREFLIELSKRIINGNEYYSLRCLGENDVTMGYVNFSVNKNTLWLIMLETYEQYQNRGIGTALLQTMEVVGTNLRCRYINGKYYPENEYALPTYTKMNYTVPNQNHTWEDYDPERIMSKHLDNDEVRKYASNMKPIIKNEEVSKKR